LSVVILGRCWSSWYDWIDWCQRRKGNPLQNTLC